MQIQVISLPFLCDRIVDQLGKLRPFIHVSFAVSLVGAVLSFLLGHEFARDTTVRGERGGGGLWKEKGGECLGWVLEGT